MEELLAYYPGRGFPAVSLTGGRCDLGCDHCRGERLRGMLHGDPLSLHELADGAEGVMLSGGCDESGRLDLSPALPGIAALRSEGKRVAVHAVLPSEEDCRSLAASGVEAICLDLHADSWIIREVLHLDASAEDYERSLRAALSSGAKAFPHVTVGMSEEDWRRSLETAARCGAEELAILGLMSTPGTPWEGREAGEEEMLSAFRHAMDLGLRPSLGCMRPRSFRLLEGRLLEMGVRRMASPSRRTLRAAEGMGIEVRETGLCCCLDPIWPSGRNPPAWGPAMPHSRRARPHR